MTTKKNKYLWIRYINTLSFWKIFFILLFSYFILNIVFALVYYSLGLLKLECFLDYLYFSIVTSFTVGYGDIKPTSEIDKIIVVLHISIATIIYALTISILTIKLYLPKKTICFSKNVIINRKEKNIKIRVINTHVESIINPEMRIFFTEHCVGNVIANTKSLTTINDLPFLGIHDFTAIVPIDDTFISNLDKAVSFDKENKDQESRFRVVISVAGNNGIQQIAEIKKYYPIDFKDGNAFKAIQYNKEDQKKWTRIKYSKFGDFWSDFNKIIE